MENLTKSKARRQRDNKKKYELQTVKITNRKEKAAKKRVAAKAAWVKKDKKKNGKNVKGGASHKADLKRIEELKNGTEDSHEDSNAHGGGGDSSGGASVRG